MKESIISNASDFHEMTDSYRSGHPIFRGVANKDFDLISNFGRCVLANEKLRSKHPSIKYVVNNAHEAGTLKEFKRRAMPHLEVIPTNDWEWLTLAQHYGLPTRMLDWTANPLVALYFAVEGNTDGDSAIYAIENTSILSAVNEDESPFDITSPTLLNPTHIANRVINQQGVFTLHPNPTQAYDDESITKYIIKDGSLRKLNSMADKYGVNESTIYPGLDGIAKHIRKWHYLE